MIHLKQAVIVEGKYDKIKLSSIVDAMIITTEGFQIYKDKEKMSLISALAEKSGIIILTDSDSAGFQIRNHIKNCVKKGKIYNIYIPDIFGKEKRKTEPSKEGKLGVEGISKEILLDAFMKAGIASEEIERTETVTRNMLFDDGFIGMCNSANKRSVLLRLLKLPERLSVNGLLDALNSAFTYEEYREAVKKINL